MKTVAWLADSSAPAMKRWLECWMTAARRSTSSPASGAHGDGSVVPGAGNQDPGGSPGRGMR